MMIRTATMAIEMNNKYDKTNGDKKDLVRNDTAPKTTAITTASITKKTTTSTKKSITVIKETPTTTAIARITTMTKTIMLITTTNNGSFNGSPPSRTITLAAYGAGQRSL